MRTRIIWVGLGLASWAAIGGWGQREFHRRLGLQGEFVRLEARFHSQSELAAKNNRLADELKSFGSLKALRKKANQSTELVGNISHLRLTLHNLDVMERQLGSPQPEAVWPEGAEVLTADHWGFVGKKTPRDTLESVLWACSNSDADKLAELIAFHGAGQKSAQALFDQLPESAKAEYRQPENIVATFLAASLPTDLVAASIQVTQGSSLALINLRDQRGDASQTDLVLRADKSADGWRLDVPAKVIDAFQQKLAGPK